MNKIIGFLVSPSNKRPIVDFFNVGIKVIELRHLDYYVYIWGVGDLTSCILDKKYSLSFPLSNNLLDRNVTICLQDDEIVIENDWLASIPIFYNSKEKIISTLCNLCLVDKKIDPEGLSNFCEFGYSVFEQTIFHDVKYMKHFSKLTLAEGICIENKPDPVLDDEFLAACSDESSTIKIMKEYMSTIESELDGDILLPTSGGYDSRILNYFINDKSKIKSFTYGITKDQSKSEEVVHAKKISEIYNTDWEQIELKNFHQYTKSWLDIYGFSTHTHGMYQIEFYQNILKKYKLLNPTFLSGIFGDIWAGSVNYKKIQSFQDINSLGYSHGMSLQLEKLKTKHDSKYKKDFFNQYGAFVNNNKLNAVFTIRLKMTLISYLTQIPEYFGLPVWTPFLNFDIAKMTLNIPEERRKDRLWQSDFFSNVGLDIESMGLKTSKANKLDYEMALHTNFEPINISLMKEYIDEKHLLVINKRLITPSEISLFKERLLYIPKLGGLMRKLGFKNKFLKAIHEYYIIKAIEKGIAYES